MPGQRRPGDHHSQGPAAAPRAASVTGHQQLTAAALTVRLHTSPMLCVLLLLLCWHVLLQALALPNVLLLEVLLMACHLPGFGLDQAVQGHEGRGEHICT